MVEHSRGIMPQALYIMALLGGHRSGKGYTFEILKLWRIRRLKLAGKEQGVVTRGLWNHGGSGIDVVV